MWPGMRKLCLCITEYITEYILSCTAYWDFNNPATNYMRFSPIKAATDGSCDY